MAFIDTRYCKESFSDRRVWRNDKEIADNGIDEDNNGYIDDCFGWDYCKNKPQAYADGDSISHGSIVVHSFWEEIGDNTAGVCTMLLTALNDEEKGNVNDIIEAIRYAEENGAQICNLSMASLVQYDALEETLAKSQMLFVVPSGNYGMELTREFKCYPASYKYRNIITVGAVDDTNHILDSSNYGREYVDCYCNGVVKIEKDKYEGTSIACAGQSAKSAKKSFYTYCVCDKSSIILFN